MFALARLLVVGFLVLSVVYVCLSLYSRAVRRGKLEKEWEEEIQQGDKDTFVEAGLRAYDGSLRRKLILGVYIIPLMLISTIIYLTNFD